MINFLKLVFKAATIFAAFLFCQSAYSSNTFYQETEKKIISLLLLKQRAQALEIYQKLVTGPIRSEQIKKAQSLKAQIITTFLSAEAQDNYELASSTYILDNKQASKNLQKCLSLEPENFWCLWLELKIIRANKKNDRFQTSKTKLETLASGLTEFEPLILSLDKTTEAFKQLKTDLIKSNEFFEFTFIALVLEFERSIKAKNYSLAKDMLIKLEEKFPSYSDITFMKALLQKLNFVEDTNNSADTQLAIYRKKCKTITPEQSKKYLFDIDYCQRSFEDYL